jgi:hypothetical protein
VRLEGIAVLLDQINWIIDIALIGRIYESRGVVCAVTRLGEILHEEARHKGRALRGLLRECRV